MKQLGNSSRDRLKMKETALSSLRSSRRCFSSDELLRAAEMGISTSNGCRKIKQENDKMKEICFCSDQDMCNGQRRRATRTIFLNFISIFILMSICRWIKLKLNSVFFSLAALLKTINNWWPLDRIWACLLFVLEVFDCRFIWPKDETKKKCWWSSV